MVPTNISYLSSCIEHYLALIAACMPTLGPLFRYLRPGAWRSRIGQPTAENGPSDEAEEAGLRRGWPQHTHKYSPDSSLLHGSIDIGTPTTETGTGKETRDHYWLPPVLSRSVTPKRFQLGWRKPVESVPVSQIGRESRWKDGIAMKEEEGMEMRAPAAAAVAASRSL